MASILVVEDDSRLAELVVRFLVDHGHQAWAVSSASDALRWLSENSADVALVDLGLPDLDGLELCKRIRANFDGAIMILTARGDTLDEVAGFEAGADDYIAKPLRPEALLARIGAHLRRAGRLQSDVSWELGKLHIDCASRCVWMGEKEVSLSTSEFDLLRFLAERAGEIVTRDSIYQELLGRSFDGLDRTIDLRVSKLRKRLGDSASAPRILKSIRGSGYLLVKRV